MSVASLALTHARYGLLETARIPMAVIGSIAFPTLAFCFFVLPQRQVAESPEWAVQAISSMIVFAVMANGLFTFGLDLSSQREQAWAPYLRSLPGSPLARILGMALTAIVMMLVAMVPLLVVAFAFTAARPAPLSALAALGLALLTGLPSVLIGVVVGTTLPFKAALAVTQTAMFVLAFAGGLFLPPMLFPAWLDAASSWLPVRQAREIVIAVAGGDALPAAASLGVLAWTVVLGTLAVVLYRRDEGRRYR